MVNEKMTDWKSRGERPFLKIPNFSSAQSILNVCPKLPVLCTYRTEGMLAVDTSILRSYRLKRWYISLLLIFQQQQQERQLKENQMERTKLPGGAAQAINV